MSWDIVIFSTKQKIDRVENIREEEFLPVDFSYILETQFDKIIGDEDHREIKGDGFSICYFTEGELTATMIFNLYGKWRSGN